jgi:hypothetical protein
MARDAWPAANMGDADRRRGGVASGARRTAEAREAYADVEPFVTAGVACGVTLEAMATALNASGRRTRDGKEFTRHTVFRIARRARRSDT